jgi:hypothetical protein
MSRLIHAASTSVTAADGSLGAASRVIRGVGDTQEVRAHL